MTSPTLPTVFLHDRSVAPNELKRRTMEEYAHRKSEKHLRVLNEMKATGLGWYGMSRATTETVENILRYNEHVVGAVYGYSPEGFALLTATDHRVLFIDKKFMFSSVDEVPYDSIQGVSKDIIGPVCTVTLHTKIGDYTITTIGKESALRFVDYIEQRTVEDEGDIS